MPTIKKYHWFSFAGVNENIGVVQVESTSQDKAFEKIQELDLIPLGMITDVKCFTTDVAEIELDRFFSADEMIALKYEVKEFPVSTEKKLKDALKINNNQLN
tara:strand:+ start:1528 stop:1833 length:306 start_codon:yes stop_codon:yes gene_type:complete